VNKEIIEHMVINFLDNHIGGGLSSSFSFEANEFTDMNGNGQNNYDIEQLLFEELYKYNITYTKKGE